MTTEKKSNQLLAEPEEYPAARQKEPLNLDVWSRVAPIRLAGYDDDPAESHILRGID
ncbi:hypothetical protein DMH02_026715 [Streptomyces sp. WAC 00631]|uniref:hypothetical protein n=1 Tax=unclassified Streptomyces TaxID=2593676 RepID=UPI00163CBA3F|nr:MULTISPECIES: hypothetical protein [unclassified Streptomyces]MCC5036666.1 hypothetical protein [Streptomyces sp. WAC 00631]MCC9738193.1 hypothetical protein [Streptomyces sp. MNU89]